jgi:ethanolamine utilization cobalamin adenosyltransferase
MRVITEVELREKYKKAPFTSFTLPAGCKFTPAASQFLSERQIEIKEKNDKKPDQNKQNKLENTQDSKKINNKTAEEKKTENKSEKPEHMTHLRGKTLVSKSHPRIKFRGKLDSFTALLMKTIVDIEKFGYKQLSKDLRDLLDYSMVKMMRADVLDEPLEPLTIRGWSQQEIREISHNPERYLGVKHIFPTPEHGEIITKLNYLRTKSRELEVAAHEAFYEIPGQVEREDILQALNRYSSLIYVMMAGLVSGLYKPGD